MKGYRTIIAKQDQLVDDMLAMNAPIATNAVTAPAFDGDGEVFNSPMDRIKGYSSPNDEMEVKFYQANEQGSFIT